MRLWVYVLLFACVGAEELHATWYNFSPQPFTDVMRGRYDAEYYDIQAVEWGEIAEGECATDESWYQYYKAADYANKFGSGAYALDDIFDAAAQVLDPEGFYLNYLHCARIFGSEEGWPYLLKAHAAEPERYEAYPALITYYTLIGQIEKRSELLVKMHRAEPIPAGVMDYNYNQLVGCPEGAILLTVGDADTYPSWLLQTGFGFRSDIEVLNLSLLLMDEAHRRRTLTRLGLEVETSASEMSAVDLIRALVSEDRALMLAVSGRPYYQELASERMFLTGLTFQYSDSPIDNLSLLHENYTQNWRTETVFNPLSSDAGQQVADELGQNYLPALLELRQYHLDRFDDRSSFVAAEIEAQIRRLALRSGISAEIEGFLGSSEVPQLASDEPGIHVKRLLKTYPFIPSGTLKLQDESSFTINGFHMGSTEISNSDYQQFLEDLLSQRKFEYLDSAAVIDFQLEGLLSESLVSLGIETLESRGKINSENHPVLNISHRAAELYAIWLTQVVNQDQRREGERKVRFRLPTREEWMYAARGGRQHAPYPWGGPYIRNARGCYLSNFNTDLTEEEPVDTYFFDRAGQPTLESEQTDSEAITKEQRNILSRSSGCPDGAWLTTAVDAYFPNDLGLYNMSGNAAEMIAEPGMTMGGSWLDGPYYMQIETVHEIVQPHPSTGFRLVMEYVD
ncbi:MAG: SUMF1/EgtB/PvdO family nonheme iron enzyme [Bacteroidota bacterium]